MNVPTFSGLKTYAVSIAIIVVAGLQAQGYITAELGNTLNAVLMGGGFAALRAGVARRSNETA